MNLRSKPPLIYISCRFFLESSPGLQINPSRQLLNAWGGDGMNDTGEFVSSISTEAEIVGGTINLAVMSVEGRGHGASPGIRRGVDGAPTMTVVPRLVGQTRAGMAD